MKRGQAASAATVGDLEKALRAAGDPERAAGSVRFFKTGKGEYGEGDRFLGVPVAEQRRLARRHAHLPLADVARLLDSPVHELRFTALEILKAKLKKADAAARLAIVDFYLAHTARINNWDLVDTSAREVLGDHLAEVPANAAARTLDGLARSTLLWDRRIAIVATHAFIKRDQIDHTLRVAALLLGDRHDLMHKAVGWMLREAAIVDRARVLAFLREHYAGVPRTALRYAIEHLDAAARRRVLAGDF